jgi:bacteriorhodopsin
MILFSFVLHVVFKCMVAADATRRLSEDRQSGALELLLVTPLSPADIIRGQQQALKRLFRWPKWILVFMNLLLLCQVLWPEGGRWTGPDKSIFAIIFASGIAFLFADCHVMGPVGICSALTTRRHPRAIWKTLRNVLLPSWLAILTFWFVGMTGGAISSDTVQTLVVVWVIFGLSVDAVMLASARARLGFNFRELAASGQARAVATTPDPSP